VAVARERCLYCGQVLPSPLVPRLPIPDPPGSVAPEAPGPARTLVILDLDAADPERLESVLGLATYEAALLARRRGFHLHRLLAPELAEAEARRLHAGGLRVETVAEEELRDPPLRALGGERGRGSLTLRTEEGPVTLHRGDLLIVVRGPIARQYQPVFRRRRVDTASLEEGYRVHLHRRADRRPVEIDIANFEFGTAGAGSTRLELEAWVDEIRAEVAEDDGFRRLPPAFGVAEPEPRGPLAAASALGRAGRGERAEGESVVLDNAAQFRFYSAWRAALERRRAG
jgi:hypothetical protein